VPASLAPAESGDGDRVEAPSRENDPASPGGSSAFDRLKSILFGDERGTLAALEARVREVEAAQQDLPERLTAAVERAQPSRMAKSLARPVTEALGSAVEQNRQLIVDVLFPVIGPAIRKAIAEALRNLVADLNGAIESSLTPRGIRWRIEAWRSGVPYAEVVLRHTLKYGIDHVFLIERDSGLVLDRESAPHLPTLDADAIAGMLTAIGEFVRDSVGRDGSGTLDAARVGEHLLWVVQGPRANLACFIHGVPPAKLRTLLEQRLEAIHATLADGRDADEPTRRSLHPDVLMREASAASAAPPAKSRWPVYAVAFVAIGSAAWLVSQRLRDQAWIADVRAKLDAHAGFVTTRIERVGGALHVHGLLDPDAEPLDATALGGARPRMPIELDTLGYVSTDDAIVARRARRLLDAPASVEIDARGGALALGGHADGAWIMHAEDKAAWVPGVGSVAFTVASDTDAAALRARRQIERLVGDIAFRRVAFVRDTELADGAAAALDALASDMARVEALAQEAGAAVAWTAIGSNDDPGTDSINARLRAERARWLADALVARGFKKVRADAGAGAAAQSERAAFVRPDITWAKP
jgi:hypothetical protein